MIFSTMHTTKSSGQLQQILLSVQQRYGVLVGILFTLRGPVYGS